MEDHEDHEDLEDIKDIEESRTGGRECLKAG